MTTATRDVTVRPADPRSPEGRRLLGASHAYLSSLYPPGILIGRVTSVGRADTDLFTQVQLEPFADLSSLEAVLVLVPSDRSTP